MKLIPKQLFLIDGLGALLSAFLLVVVLVAFEEVFGIPRPMLYLLASLPVGFAVYDFLCFRTANRKYLKGTATMNLLYCVLSIGLAIYHSEAITTLGWAYLIIEILIVVTLAVIELRVAKGVSIYT